MWDIVDLLAQHYHQQRERLMRQMWSSEQQWRKESSEQQGFNEERDEGGRGFDHWEREEDEEVVKKGMVDHILASRVGLLLF